MEGNLSPTAAWLALAALCAGILAVVPLHVPAASGAPAVAATVPATASAPADAEGRTMLVMDSSGSMAEPAGGGVTKIEAAKTALRNVVDGLPEAAEVGFRVFGAEVFSREEAGACRDSQQVVEPTAGNRAELESAIDDYEPFGETPIPHALGEAAADLGDEGPRSILLVSDGESNCPPDPCDIAAELREQGVTLRIDVVGLAVSGEARDQLRCIAENGGGVYYDADDADDIEESLERAAERAVRPFTLSGEPVDGGPEEDPTPIGPGDWIDEVEDGDDERFFAVEKTEDDSTLRVSAISQAGGSIASIALRLAAEADGGGDCAFTNESTAGTTPFILSASVYSAPEEDCDRGAGIYLIEVGAGMTGPRQDVQIRVSEEPPVEDPGFEDTGEPEVRAPQTNGEPRDVVAGTSFRDAAELDTGRWADDIVAGEVLVYRVPLNFGQGLDVAVEFDGGDRTTAELRIYNPMQTRLPAAESVDGEVPEETLLGAVPAVSRARSVDPPADAVDVGDVTLAGDYYLTLSLETDDETVIRPFTVDVEVNGEPSEGPTYADDVTWSVADGTDSDEPADAPADEPSEPPAASGAEAAPAESDESADSGSDDGTVGGVPLVLVGGGAAGFGALLVAVVLVAALRARRRRP